MRRKLVDLLLGVLCIFLLVAGYCLYLINLPFNDADRQTYVVQSGASLYSVARELTTTGIVKWPERMLRFYGLMTRSQGQLKAGEYDLTAVKNTMDLLALLRSGRVIQRDITFLEGWTFADWRDRLAQETMIDHRLPHLSDVEIMRQLGHPQSLPEGWFFPDTYRFIRGESDIEILRRAHKKMQRVLAREWSGRSVGDALSSPYAALVLASIIEKETSSNADRGKVSQVFSKRLAENMKLQSDPTVVYGLGAEFTGNLTRAHLLADTPYNTYVHAGLPPTPISMPGLASIQAALHPEPGTFLYFVAKGDGNSYFSVDLDEHNAAVERYQRSGRRADYQSAPR